MYDGEPSDEEDDWSKPTGDALVRSGGVDCRDTSISRALEEGKSAPAWEVPSKLKLHLEVSSIGPKRCVLTRDMARGDALRPRPSIHWDGPQIEFAVPIGMSIVPCEIKLGTYS